MRRELEILPHRVPAEQSSPWLRNLLARQRLDKLDRSILADMVEHIRIYENRRILIIYTFTPADPPMAAALPGV